MWLSDEGNKIQEERKDAIFMEKKWPAYIAIVIICIPIFVVLGFAQELSTSLWETAMDVLRLIVPIILAGIIGYMDDALTFAEKIKLRKAIIYAVITGIVCGVSMIFAESVSAVITVVLAAVMAVKVKGFVGEYREMKEMLNYGTDDQDTEK